MCLKLVSLSLFKGLVWARKENNITVSKVGQFFVLIALKARQKRAEAYLDIQRHLFRCPRDVLC